MFACHCGGEGGGCGRGDGGSCGGDSDGGGGGGDGGGAAGHDGGGGGGTGGGGTGDGGGDFGGDECFQAYLWDSCWRWDAFPNSRRGGLGPFGPEMHLCCYTNTCTKYPSTLIIEMQTIFKQVELFIKCPVNIKEMKSFVMGHGLQPPVDVQDLVVM